MRFINRRSARSTSVAVVLLAASIGIVLQVARVRSPIRHTLEAAVKPPLSKDKAIERVEQLGGKVGIDGELENQPVWMVDLSETPITGADLAVLLSFPDLEVLNLAFTAVGDADLKDLEGIPKLRELNLSRTQITNEAASTLVRCRRLKVLQLNQTAFTDQGLELLAKHPTLADVSAEGTNVTEQGQTRFRLTRQMAVVTDDGNPEQARRFHQMGRLYLLGAHRDPKVQDRGIELLERAVIAAPKNDEYKLDLADAYALLDLELTLAAAIDLYEDVLSRRTDDEQLLGQLAKAYTALENLEQAQELIERRLQKVPPAGVFDVVTQIVGIVAAGGDRTWALQLMRTAVRQSPDDPRVQLLLAGLLVEERLTAEARTLANRVLSKSGPDNPIRIAAEEILSELEDHP